MGEEARRAIWDHPTGHDDTKKTWHSRNDEALSRYVNRVLKSIRASACPNRDSYCSIPNEVFVLDTNAIQAWTNGYEISLTWGMFSSMRNEAELACLLAHEAHHIRQSSRSDDNRGRNTRSKIISAVSPDILRRTGIEQDVLDASYTQYDRDRETDADEQGSLICARAGYRAYALGELLERLSQLSPNGFLQKVQRLKGSHEALGDRAQHLADYLAQNKISPDDGVINAAQFQAVKSKATRGESPFTPAQKSRLAELTALQSQLDQIVATAKPVKPAEFLRLMRHLSRVGRAEKITPQELRSIGFGAKRDHFMAEELFARPDDARDYRPDFLDRYGDALYTASRIALGFVPIAGSAVDIYELLSGEDYFTGERLSVRDRSFIAVGLAAGQGKVLRELDATLLGVAKNSRAEQRAAQSIVKEAEALNDDYSSVVRRGPMNPGPLEQIVYDDGSTVADTFRSGAYNELTLKEPRELYRVDSKAIESGAKPGKYFTAEPPKGPVQSTVDSALHPSMNNQATHWTKVKVPEGTTVFEGFAAPQGEIVGGGSQIYIPDPQRAWILEQGRFE